MCFSAVASFVAAGVTGVIGIASLTRVDHPRQIALAATPVFFAVQQSVEGLLWLHLPLAPDGSISSSLTLLYLMFADVFWPIYAPLMVLLIEPNDARRHLMLPLFAIGAAVGTYLFWQIVTHPRGALFLDDHIVYVAEYTHSAAVAVVVAIGYLAATSLPLILSSQRTVVILGATILVGCSIAYAFYWEAFVSIWCFFAAAASAVILCHFERVRRQRLRVARA